MSCSRRCWSTSTTCSAPHGRIETSPQGLRLGALVAHDRGGGPSRRAAATTRSSPSRCSWRPAPQLRNMATLGGNVLQRTRCEYFRDARLAPATSASPAPAAPPSDGVNRKHAVLGVGDQCIAELSRRPRARRSSPSTPSSRRGARAACAASRFEELHRGPGRTPHVETVLTQGELITGYPGPERPLDPPLALPEGARPRSPTPSRLASAAVALDLDGDVVREARIALGGVAYRALARPRGGGRC